MTQIDRFWKLLADSGLVTVARLAQLQADFQQLRGAARANPPVLAQWLISEGLMTGYHASVLLKGRPGPFFYGDFLVRDIHLAGRLAGTFPAVHQPTGHPVLLVFFGQNQSADPVSWAATVAWGAECFPLDVPQLATCHELVDTGDFRFAVLDDLHGAALAESLQDGRALSVPRAAGLIYDVAQALHTLHTAGHAHGDLSPQNILQNGSGHGQLLYFPLSRSDHTRAAPLDLQRANYAAPELNPQQPMPTPAADMYALGCTLYHALAGNPPFPEPDANVAQKMARHAAQPVVPLHQQNAVPPQVSQIVSRMMAKDLSNRYVDAGSVLAALGPWVDPARTPALPPAATRGRYLAVAKRRRSTPAPAGAAATRAAPQPQSLTAAQPVTDLPIATAAGAQPAVAVDGFAPSVESPLAGQMVLPKGGSTKGPQPWWQKRTNRNNLIVAGSVALIALLLLPMAISKWPKREAEKTTLVKKDESPASEPAGEQPPPENGSAKPAPDNSGGTAETDDKVGGQEAKGPRSGERVVESLVDDDGRTLWASPTGDSPPDPPELRYLPTGARVVFILRTADLFAGDPGAELRAAMGPAGSQLAEWIKSKTTFQLDEIERLDIALYPPNEGRLEYCLVVYPSQPLAKEALLARWGNPVVKQYVGAPYYQRGETAFYLPQSGAHAFACGAEHQIKKVIDTLEETAWLADSMEKLRLQTAAQRHLNILFLSDFVRSTREALYPGQLGPLYEVVGWLLGPGEETKAGLLSVHVGRQLFLELRLFCAREKEPRVVAEEVYERLDEAPAKLSAHLFSLAISPYSRPVLATLNDMLRALHQYTRFDRDQPQGQQAVLRCYLPARAARHLAVATDLALLETRGTSAVSTPAAAKPQTVWERLKQPTTLVFERDNLINAIQSLSDDMGVTIEILGNDLELDGITKNQSFGIDIRDQPAESILTQIVLGANPTKVSDPRDPALKLIYVVKEKHQGGDDLIWITTRAQAARRGDTVPPQFQQEGEK